MAGPLEGISIREYARRKGLSDTYVRRMITFGVITPRSVGRNARNQPVIFESLADEDWAKNHGAGRSSAGAAKSKKAPADPESPASDIADAPRANGHLPGGGRSKAEIDRLASEVKLQILALELKQKKGELVDKAKVYRALMEIGQILRKDLLTIPDKKIDEIRAANERHEAHRVLVEAITEVLTSISSMGIADIKISER